MTSAFEVLSPWLPKSEDLATSRRSFRLPAVLQSIGTNSEYAHPKFAIWWHILNVGTFKEFSAVLDPDTPVLNRDPAALQDPKIKA